MGEIVTVDLLDEELEAVVRAGPYSSREEAVGHALEVLLTANPRLRVGAAVDLYASAKVTLSRGAEIAGLELDAFKERLAWEAIPVRVDEEPEDVVAGAETIRRLLERP